MASQKAKDKNVIKRLNTGENNDNRHRDRKKCLEKKAEQRFGNRKKKLLSIELVDFRQTDLQTERLILSRSQRV